MREYLKIPQEIHTRIATQNDLAAILNLFAATVKTVCAKDYTPVQIDAWVSSINNPERWESRITQQYFIIAKTNKEIVGFGSLDHLSYIDLLYVHKDYQGMGIATQILSELEKEAFRSGTTELTSDVSKTARPFFEKNGFQVTSEQTVAIAGVQLNNYKMVKKCTQSIS